MFKMTSGRAYEAKQGACNGYRLILRVIKFGLSSTWEHDQWSLEWLWFSNLPIFAKRK